MTAVREMEKSRPGRGRGGLYAAGSKLLGGIAGQYAALKRRLGEMLMRGDRDYAKMSELSQEIGRMRQRIRTELHRRREERKQREAAKKVTSGTL